jgi:hypothetical protein
MLLRFWDHFFHPIVIFFVQEEEGEVIALQKQLISHHKGVEKAESSLLMQWASLHLGSLHTTKVLQRPNPHC